MDGRKGRSPAIRTDLPLWRARAAAEAVALGMAAAALNAGVAWLFFSPYWPWPVTVPRLPIGDGAELLMRLSLLVVAAPLFETAAFVAGIEWASRRWGIARAGLGMAILFALGHSTEGALWPFCIFPLFYLSQFFYRRYREAAWRSSVAGLVLIHLVHNLMSVASLWHAALGAKSEL